MAFTELYIDQSGYAYNGGSSPGAPKVTLTSEVDAALIAGHEYTLTITTASTWGTASVGDFLCYGDSYVWCRILELNYGSDSKVIRVEPVNESTTMAATDKSCRVGGAWDKLGNAEPFLAQATATTWGNMGLTTTPPRLNCKKEASAYSESVYFDSYGSWSALIPLRIEGYETSPGDIDWQHDEKWADFDWGNNAVNGINVLAYTSVHNLIIRNNRNGASTPLYSTTLSSRMLNCKIQRAAGAAYGITYRLSGAHLRCTFETNQNYTVTQVTGFASAARFIGCLFRSTGTIAAGAAGALLNILGTTCVVKGCIFHNGYNGIAVGAGYTGCQIENNIFHKMLNHGIACGDDPAVSSLSVNNNIFVDMGAYALSAATTGAVEPQSCENNAYYDCDSGFYDASKLVIRNSSNIALGGDPFVDGDSQDFNLKDNTLARAACPLMLPGTVNIPNGSIGALNFYDLPADDSVLDSDRSDGVTGHYHGPLAAEVISTAVFGPASGTAGTFDEAARNTDPGVANVLNTAGNYKILNVTKTPTFDEAARNTDPGVEHVLLGEIYKILNVAKTGVLEVEGGVPEDPIAFLRRVRE